MLIILILECLIKNIRAKVKNNIQNKIKKLDIKDNDLDGLSVFFQELSLEKLDIKSVSKFKNWLSFCNKLRGKKMEDIDASFKDLLINYL